jgi:hypothetical protein
MATEPRQAAKADEAAYLSAMGRALISTGRKYGDEAMVQRGIAKLQRLPPGTPRALKLPPGSS